MVALTVRIHTLERQTDITRFVTSVTWSEGVSAPWDSVQLELAAAIPELTEGERRDVTPVGPERARGQRAPVVTESGTWVTVHRGSELLALARVRSVTTHTDARSDGAIATRVSVDAVGALEFVRTLAAEFVPYMSQGVGGIIGANGAEAWSSLVARLAQKLDPALIPEMLRFLANVRLPPTLIPGVTALPELWSMVYNRETGNEYLGTHAVVAVPLSPAVMVGSLWPSATVADYIMGVFQTEPRLVEFFPLVSRGRPLLVHRIAPFSPAPVSQMGGGPVPRDLDVVTWVPRVTIPAGHIVSVSSTRSEDARCNALTVTASIAGNSLERLLPLSGLPLIDRRDVHDNGVKLLELRWDIAPTEPEDAVQPLERLRGVALLAWQFYGGGEVFKSGEIRASYSPELRAGMPFNATNGARRFSAYATKVTHSAHARPDGAISLETSIYFERGLSDEAARTVSYYDEWRPPAEGAPEPAGAPGSSATVKWGETELPWPYDTVMIRDMCITHKHPDRRRLVSSFVDVAVVHQSGGWSNDYRAVARALNQGGKGVHFAIQPDGVVVQLQDLATVAYHAGEDMVNDRSIGIELMSPGYRNSRGRPASVIPWEPVEGFQINRDRSMRTTKFYGITPAQSSALARLLRFLSDQFGIAHVSPLAVPNEPKRIQAPRAARGCWESVAAGGLGFPVVPGVYHHIEIFNPGKTDALGVILPDILRGN